MDPNATLHRLRELVALAQKGTLDPDQAAIALDEVAENFDALDGWMTRGGYAPDAWRETEDHR